jgi:hypothetical protein
LVEKIANNVIQFPKANSRMLSEVVAIEDISRNVEMMKLYHIQETIANLAPMIFNQLEISGFSISDEELTDIKDGAFIVEALRSMMSKYYKIYHPFQQIAENVFTPDAEEIGALRIADSLNIELKNSVKQ